MKLWNKQITKGKRLSNDRDWGHDKLHMMEHRNLSVCDNLSKERVRTGGHTVKQNGLKSENSSGYASCCICPECHRVRAQHHCLEIWGKAQRSRIPTSSHGCLTETRLLQRALCTYALPFFFLQSWQPHLSTLLWPSEVTYFPISQDSQRVACFTNICYAHFSSKFLSHSADYEGFFSWRSTMGSIRDRLPPLWLLFASVTPWVIDFKFHRGWEWTAILIWM